MVVETIDTDTGTVHQSIFDEDLDTARELFVPGQELTVSYSRKSGAPTMTGEGDPRRADKYRNAALAEEDKTEGQRKDEAKSKQNIKDGVIDKDAAPKGSK
jgi:hypothetical protein